MRKQLLIVGLLCSSYKVTASLNVPRGIMNKMNYSLVKRYGLNLLMGGVGGVGVGIAGVSAYCIEPHAIDITAPGVFAGLDVTVNKFPNDHRQVRVDQVRLVKARDQCGDTRYITASNLYGNPDGIWWQYGAPSLTIIGNRVTMGPHKKSDTIPNSVSVRGYKHSTDPLCTIDSTDQMTIDRVRLSIVERVRYGLPVLLGHAIKPGSAIIAIPFLLNEISSTQSRVTKRG